MWITSCSLKGYVTIDDESTIIKGTAFFDYPRLTKENNNPKEFGSYLHTPIVLDDGSHFFSCYSDSIDGERNENYSFRYLVDKNPGMTYYCWESMKNLWFTPENQMECASLIFVNVHSEIHISMKEEYLPIHRSWGNMNVSLNKNHLPSTVYC